MVKVSRSRISAAVFLGVLSKIYGLLVFLFSIRLVSYVFKFETGEDIGIFSSFINLNLNEYWIAIFVFFCFCLTGVIDYFSLKARSVLILLSLSEFRVELNSRNHEISALNQSRSENSFRLLVDDFLAIWIFSLVSFFSCIALCLVNFYFGLGLLIASICAVALSRLLFFKDYFASELPNIYMKRIGPKIIGINSSDREMLAQKFKNVYFQQMMLFISHCFMGLMLAMLVFLISSNAIPLMNLFDLVVFMYVTRFLLSNGRNAVNAYVKYYTHKKNIYKIWGCK